MSIKVTRDEVVNLFAAIGISSAAKWNAQRMTTKINALNEIVDADTELEGEENKATMKKVLAAIEAGKDIVVVATGSVDAEPKAKDTPKVKPKTSWTAPKEEPEDETEGETEDEPAPKAKKEKAAPAPKVKKEKAAPVPKVKTGPEGVRECKSRPYLAGVVIREAGGLKVGITDDMVAKLDELYGKKNPAESLFTLRNAWHAIRGVIEA